MSLRRRASKMLGLQSIFFLLLVCFSQIVAALQIDVASPRVMARASIRMEGAINDMIDKEYVQKDSNPGLPRALPDSRPTFESLVRKTASSPTLPARSSCSRDARQRSSLPRASSP